MRPVAKQLDIAHGDQNYADALEHMQSAIVDSSITPSATMLNEMQEHNENLLSDGNAKSEGA